MSSDDLKMWRHWNSHTDGTAPCYTCFGKLFDRFFLSAIHFQKKIIIIIYLDASDLSCDMWSLSLLCTGFSLVVLRGLSSYRVWA